MIRPTLFILIVSLMLLGIAGISHAELAAPHNAANNIGCSNYCHILPTVKSPYWNHAAQNIDDTPTNHLCNSCHTATSGPFSMINASAVKTHSSLSTDTDYGNWTIGCTDCHSPHFQEQLQWMSSTGDANMFLATGRITNFSYNGVDGESLLFLAPGTLQFKTGWDAAGLVKKTGEYRRTILLPDRFFRATDQTGSLSFQVVAVDEIAETITVKGNVTPVYSKSILPSDFGIIYGQLIRQEVKRNGFTQPVTFFDNTADGKGGFTDQAGAVFPKGICQVCHTKTSHWSPKALAAGDVHYPDRSCAECHSHASGFAHSGGVGGSGCGSCHDHETIVNTPSFCQSAGCHDSGVFSAHKIDASTGSNCAFCHEVNNRYSLPGDLVDRYLADNVAWDPDKKKNMLTSASRCDDCHQGLRNEHVTDTGHGKLHDKALLGYDTDNNKIAAQVLACDICHFADVVQEHVSRRRLSCSVCHNRAELGLPEVAAITSTISAGMAGDKVFCSNCHNDNHFLTTANTSLVKEHHETSYSKAGNCTKCHVVGPGERGPKRPPCWYCHATGKPGDPQRPAANKHDQGPAITENGVKDYRACFSCHLNGGPGYVAGKTPPVIPMHGLPGTPPDYHSNIYWPYGYYKDSGGQWQASVPLMPTASDPTMPGNTEGDFPRWQVYPGFATLNYLGTIKPKDLTYNLGIAGTDIYNWAQSVLYSRVKYDYKKRDYPTVSIQYGDTFEIPSFDGTGTLGMPTGSGSVSVTINPNEAIAAGARWRLDGGPWRNSGVVVSGVTDRSNHLIEFKPLAGMDEPPAIQATVVNGQATALSGAVATYTTCPEDSRLQVARTSGNTASAFSWTKPEQEESFLTTGWRAGPVECEVFLRSGGKLLPAEGFATRTSTAGDSCQLYKTGITPAGSYDLLLRATGSSCFRNSVDLPLAVTVTTAGAPSPTGEAGGKITQPFLKSLSLPTSANQDFIHLAGNLYVHLNNAGVISTFTIDNQGNISPVIKSVDLWPSFSKPKMARVSDTLIAVSYDSGGGRIMTVGIEQGGTVIYKKQDYLFHVAPSVYVPQIYPHKDNPNYFIVTSTSTSHPYPIVLLTVQILQSGEIIELARNTTLTGDYDSKSSVAHVAGNKYVLAHRDYSKSQNSLRIFEVSSSGAITIPGTPGSVYQYPFVQSGKNAEILQVKGDVFALAYGSNPGNLKTIRISNSGVISPTINTYMFEPCGTGFGDSAHLATVADSIIALYYHNFVSCGGPGGLLLKTHKVTDDGRIMVPPLDVLSLKGGGSSPKLLHVSGDIFAFLVVGDASGVPTFSGVKTFKISRDNDADGIADSVDNCPTQANAGQIDSDGDGAGDGCDACAGVADSDSDGDGLKDCLDSCPNDPANDADNDGLCGDIDPCPDDPGNDADNDGLCGGNLFLAPKTGAKDNCPAVQNSSQADSDCDGAGDACSTPAYQPPLSLTATALSNTESAISWKDMYAGEHGYRIERKAESCGANTLSFTPITTIYQHDDFATGIDQTAWNQGGVIKETSSTVPPILVSGASGFARVSWENGAAKLHTKAVNIADSEFNYSYISPKNFAGIIGDRDFDIQTDFRLPNGTISATEYHTYARLLLSFPNTGGQENHMYIERNAGGIGVAIKVNGVTQNSTYPLTDYSGTIRLVRKNRILSGYMWNGAGWRLLLTHSQPQTENLVPSWFEIVNHARRNEPAGQEITALIDNFRFNMVGTRTPPTAKLSMAFDEVGWLGASGEVKDSAIDGNHGTAMGGATTAWDGERGRVGIFDWSDGVADYVSIPGNGTLQNVTSKSFTFAAWAKPKDAPPQTQAAPPGNDWVYAVMTRSYPPDSLTYGSGKTFTFSIFDTAWGQTKAIDPTVYEPGTWHHLAGVADDITKTISLYVDGQLKATTSYAGKTLFNTYGTSDYLVGISNPPGPNWIFPFKGKIDDVRVFDRALNSDEVTALYSDNSAFKDTGLVAGATYCYRVYPVKNDSCTGWANHAATAQVTTRTAAEANATTPGRASAVVLITESALRVTMPYSADANGNNTYTVAYRKTGTSSWTTFVDNAAHTASPYSTLITGLTPGSRYDVRVTFTDPDGTSGNAEQTLAALEPLPAPSCKQIVDNSGSTGDGIYWLDADGAGAAAPYQAYCDMTTDGGGWTLAMKLDGSQSTFQYSANYWTTANTLNPGSIGFDTIQAKLQTFNDVGFTQVRLGMRHYTDANDDIDWITVNQASSSLVTLFNSGYTSTTVGRANWLNLLEGVENQPNCNKEGFNAEQNYSKMRIGLAMNDQNDCTSCDRIIGFGNQVTGHPWGNWAVVGGGYPGRNLVAYGWIFVR